MENARYMISDAANIVNVESHVLRYWEEELELAIPRNEMGHRYYTEENIAQFQKIKEWKEQGYQLKAIRMMIHNSSGGNQVVRTNHEYSEAEPSYPVKHHNNSAANTVKLEQFQIMMTNIVRQAMEDNNTALGKEVGVQVGESGRRTFPETGCSHPHTAKGKEVWQEKEGEREKYCKNIKRREEVKSEFNYMIIIYYEKGMLVSISFLDCGVSIYARALTGSAKRAAPECRPDCRCIHRKTFRHARVQRAGEIRPWRHIRR